MNLLNNLKIQQYLYTNRPKNISVHYGQTSRFDKAKEQASLEPIQVQKVIEYSNNFLKSCGIQCNFENYINLKDRSPEGINESVQRDYGLNHPQDIIWMKFTEDGYLGVVAMSNDINFDIPPSPSVYDEKEKGHWKYTTSGIIVDYLKKTWDTSFVLLFPIPGVSEKAERHIIEVGIGNYLIEKGVPILDFYSHRL